MTLIVRYAASRKRSADAPTVYSVTEEDDVISCDCQGFAFRQSCRHVIAVERYRKWRINLPTDRVLPPPAAWVEREIPIGETTSPDQSP